MGGITRDEQRLPIDNGVAMDRYGVILSAELVGATDRPTWGEWTEGGGVG